MDDEHDTSAGDVHVRRMRGGAVDGAFVRAIEGQRRQRLKGALERLSRDNQILHDSYSVLAREHALGWVNFACLSLWRRWLICRLARGRVVGLEFASDANEHREPLPPRPRVGGRRGGAGAPP
jgi:hypothetical protein